MTIVSFAYRFIFCKTMKTAGTALEVSIASRLPATDVVTPLVPLEPAIGPETSGTKASDCVTMFPWPESEMSSAMMLKAFKSFH